MPNGDRTGPLGRGSRTGRKQGFCSGNQQAGNANKTHGEHHESGKIGRGKGREEGRHHSHGRSEE